MKRSTKRSWLVVCVNNDGYDVDLQARKIYRALADPAAEEHQMIRVIDDSGEDYLYPATRFRPIALTAALHRALRFGGSAPRTPRRQARTRTSG